MRAIALFALFAIIVSFLALSCVLLNTIESYCALLQLTDLDMAGHGCDPCCCVLLRLIALYCGASRCKPCHCPITHRERARARERELHRQRQRQTETENVTQTVTARFYVRAAAQAAELEEARRRLAEAELERAALRAELELARLQARLIARFYNFFAPYCAILIPFPSAHSRAGVAVFSSGDDHDGVNLRVSAFRPVDCNKMQ